jgi:hypothetical protein
LASALLTGCGFVTSPEVPDVPDVECDPAFDDDERVDFVDVDLVELDLVDEDFVCVDFVDVDFVLVDFVVDVEDFGEDCEDAAALPLPLPDLAKAVPPTPSEIIIKSSAATTDVSGRARSNHARTMEIPAIPPGLPTEPDSKPRTSRITATPLMGFPPHGSTYPPPDWSNARQR